jgi:hypothetical protein
VKAWAVSSCLLKHFLHHMAHTRFEATSSLRKCGREPAMQLPARHAHASPPQPSALQQCAPPQPQPAHERGQPQGTNRSPAQTSLIVQGTSATVHNTKPPHCAMNAPAVTVRTITALIRADLQGRCALPEHGELAGCCISSAPRLFRLCRLRRQLCPQAACIGVRPVSVAQSRLSAPTSCC